MKKFHFFDFFLVILSVISAGIAARISTTLSSLQTLSVNQTDDGIQNQCVNDRNISGPWSEILEDWVLSHSENAELRSSRVTKLGDEKIVTNHIIPSNKRDVTETDLYLLGAIEKLVYRVDFLEKRLRRAEELLYYVISGNIGVKEPCPSNYTRINQKCYHFGEREFDWKSAVSFCRGMGGRLVEFETTEEYRDVASNIPKDSNFRRIAFWTGGLNPGLLWIWASSAKPVHRNMKETVPGDGRCLKLAYDLSLKTYSYKGEDCGTRQRYICELTQDNESANKIEGTARMLMNRIKADE